MKKLLVLLSLMIMLALASCTVAPPPDAGNGEGNTDNNGGGNQTEEADGVEELLKTVGEKMDELVSYKGELSTQLVYYIRGYEVKATGTGLQIEIDNENEYYYYQSMSMVGGSKDLSLDIDRTTINAYNDGKAFLCNIGGNVDQRFCSDMTRAQFVAYLDDITEIAEDDIDLCDCTIRSLTEKEDGTRTVTLSGYTARTMNKLFMQNGVDLGSLGIEIIDVEIVIKINADNLITEQICTAEFAEPELASMVPEYVISVKYSEYNEATPATDGIDMADYDEIADVALLVNIEKMLEKRQNATSGSLAIDISQKTEIPTLSRKILLNEQDAISYGTEGGKYFYTIHGTVNDARVTVEYSNGKQKITKRGSTTQTAPQSELEAREYINGLINYAGYDRQNVVSVKKTLNGVYEIVLKAQAGRYQQLYASNNGRYKSATETITVTVKGDKITRIEFKADVRGEYTYNNISYDMPTTIVTEIRFAD